MLTNHSKHTNLELLLLPATADRWNGDGRDVFLVGKSEAVLYNLLQVADGIGPAPAGAIDMNNILGRQIVGGADCSCKG